MRALLAVFPQASAIGLLWNFRYGWCHCPLFGFCSVQCFSAEEGREEHMKQWLCSICWEHFAALVSVLVGLCLSAWNRQTLNSPSHLLTASDSLQPSLLLVDNPSMLLFQQLYRRSLGCLLCAKRVITARICFEILKGSYGKIVEWSSTSLRFLGWFTLPFLARDCASLLWFIALSPTATMLMVALGWQKTNQDCCT